MIVKPDGWYVTDGHFTVGPMQKQPDGTFRTSKGPEHQYWDEAGYCHASDGGVAEDFLAMFRLHHSFDNDDPAMHRPIKPGEPIPQWERE